MKFLALMIALTSAQASIANQEFYDEHNRYQGYADSKGNVYDANNRYKGRIVTKRDGSQVFIDADNRVKGRDSCRNCGNGMSPINEEKSFK